MHYAEAGDGPPIVLLHQTPRSHDEYRELMPLVGAGRHAIAMDMYGFGMSAKPPAPQSIEQYASGVASLVDALDLERFAVMGHHTGAIVAVEVAASMPDRVEAVILSCGAYTDESCRAELGAVDVDEATQSDTGSHLAELWAVRAPYYPPVRRAELLDRFIHDALAPGIDPAEGHRACSRYRMEDRIGLVTAPVLIVGASEDPFSTPHTPLLVNALVNTTTETFVVEGGMIPLLEDHAETVAASVLSFLDSHA